ncbi:hypothetical protein [Staphylococcus pseudintermedius]|uniref:hypothetical protein n=1 Tax=Staphylococcus pseudintermedius TaxID=283734 RepID=UPI001378D2F1|nr:hypothetical protein [Staphylococcus pseudintermedius]
MPSNPSHFLHKSYHLFGCCFCYDSHFSSFFRFIIIDFYNIKKIDKHAYKHTIRKHESYTYSQQFIEFIINEIKKNPNKFVESVRNKKR